MKQRYSLLYLNKLIASGTVDEIEQSISDMKLIKPHAEKMRMELHEKGEFHYGLGLYHINKIKDGAH